MKKKRLSAQLNKPIEILSVTETDDGFGGSEESDFVFHSCNAAIWPVKANEQVQNMREELEVSHKIRIRYYPGITAQMRIRYNARTFEIKSILNPDEANKILDMVCNEYI